jgi:4-hydroxythreonine-4-phosphate dehydrogenase
VVQQAVSRIAICPGEPAGIGPDLVLALAQEPWPAELVVIADPKMLKDRADQLGKSIDIQQFSAKLPPQANPAGQIKLLPKDLAAGVVPGQLNPANADYVLDCLRSAVAGCMQHEFAAMLTGPVQKSVINQAGISFTGYTEFLAEQTATQQPVMLLVSGELRVALLTTHLALRDVPDQITAERIQSILRTLHDGLRRHFGISAPRIIVLGLNPHAGESGHMGSEEQDIIEPALAKLRAQGMQLTGPMPADTAFTPDHLSAADAVLAMYHDQGLPVLKHHGFGRSVNVTLGLPIIRTSVDHGTALDLAATGRANPGSMRAALQLAIEIQTRQEK